MSPKKIAVLIAIVAISAIAIIMLANDMRCVPPCI